MEIDENDQFEVLTKYFNEFGPVYHQLESFDYFINVMLQKIIDEMPAIRINKEDTKYIVNFGQIYVENASFMDPDKNIIYNIFPDEARKKDLTYEANVQVDIIEKFFSFDKDTKEFVQTEELKHSKVNLMKLPIMTGTSRCNLFNLSNHERVEKGECYNENYGSFIIRGKERALVAQERLNHNIPYVFNHVCEMRSISEETGHSVLIQAKYNKEKGFFFSIPYIKKDIPAGLLFKAYGFSKTDIFKIINPPINNDVYDVNNKLVDRDLLLYVVDQIIKSAGCNRYNAIDFMSLHLKKKQEEEKQEEKEDGNDGNDSEEEDEKKEKIIIDEKERHLFVHQILEKELLPHLGTSTNLEKCVILGSMLRKLILTILNIRSEDNRDNVSVKRIEHTSILLSDLFRMGLRRHIDGVIKYLEKRQDILTGMSRTTILTTNIRNCFLTGNWGIHKNAYIRTGVSQIINKLSYQSSLSNLRRICIPVGKEGKNVKLRQIDPSQIFYVDIIESPEGKSIGIVKNLALLANITTGCNSVLIKNLVLKCKNIIEYSISDQNYYIVYVNSSIMGITDKPEELYKELDDLRINKFFSNQVSYFINNIDNEIRIMCDAGRFIRPVFTVTNGKLNITKKDVQNLSFFDMLDKNLIRYVDPNEIENSVVAMTIKDITETKNYCEIHPSAMLGVCSAVIPFPEHNQCIYKNELVYMADGTTKKICEVKVNDSVITFNPKTLENMVTTVTDVFTKKTDKIMYCISTESEKSIKATFDHKFMTSNGWKILENINVNDYVAIYNFSDRKNHFERVISKKLCYNKEKLNKIGINTDIVNLDLFSSEFLIKSILSSKY